jgi:hypothetical protein
MRKLRVVLTKAPHQKITKGEQMSAVIRDEPGASFPYNFRIRSEALVDFVAKMLKSLARSTGIEPVFSP